MATKTRDRDTAYDDGLATREQGKLYEAGLLPMAQPRSKRPRRIAKVVVWGSVGVLVLGMGTSLVLTNANRSLNNELSKTLQTQYNPSFKTRFDAIGVQVINAWYAQQAPPINVDASVAWPGANNSSSAQLAPQSTTSGTGAATAGSAASGTSGATASTGGSSSVSGSSATPALAVTGVSFLSGSQIQDRGPGKRYEERLQYYALINGVPQIIGLDIAIPNLDDLTSAPVLMAAPSVVAKPSVSTVQQDQSTNPASTLGNAQLTEAATAVLNTWAAAWTADDSAGLKQVTHDADANNVYRGLGSGWLYVPSSAKAVWSVLAPAAGGNAVARVTWQIQTPPTTVQSGSGSSSNTQQIPGATQTETMDVLIGAYQSGSPSVLAWGQPGTYLDLKAGYNAFSKDAAATMAPAAPATGGAYTAPSSPANTGVRGTGTSSVTGSTPTTGAKG